MHAHHKASYTHCSGHACPNSPQALPARQPPTHVALSLSRACIRLQCPAAEASAHAQEMMKAAQCFYMEFWDLDTRGLEALTPERSVIEKLHGGWCVLMPEDTKICHLRA